MSYIVIFEKVQKGFLLFEKLLSFDFNLNNTGKIFGEFLKVHIFDKYNQNKNFLSFYCSLDISNRRKLIMFFKIEEEDMHHTYLFMTGLYSYFGFCTIDQVWPDEIKKYQIIFKKYYQSYNCDYVGFYNQLTLKERQQLVEWYNQKIEKINQN